MSRSAFADPDSGYTAASMWRWSANFCAMSLCTAVLGSAAFAQSIDIELMHFGVGDVARGGGTLAAQLKFTSGIDRVTEIEAVWEVPNADRDIVEHARRFVLNPGQSQRRWMYASIPPYPEGTMMGSIFDIRLYEVAGGERVRDLGTTRIAPTVATNPPRVIGLTEDMFLVVGPRSAGLDIYSQGNDAAGIPSMNTVTVLGNVRDADGFPDRWEGLANFDTIVWADGAIAPSRISEESVRAIREWTERGGNLVIAIPGAGDPWSVGTAGRHGFSDLLPSVAPERIEDVPVRDLLPMLSLSPALRDQNIRTRLAVFDPAKLDRGWRPFIATPAPKNVDGSIATNNGQFNSKWDGKVVGIRREFGHGHITLLGVDVEELSARGLQVPSIPNGDVFWNRILGRRADTPSGAEFTALSNLNRLASGSGLSREIGDGKRVAESIGLSSEAAIGILAATAVFGLYWLVAGPVGFAVLKSLRKERWAWVVYLAVACLFTVGIWMFGSGLSGQATRVSHLTVLDVVERAPGEADITQSQLKRATSWLSVYAPSYGEVEIALDPQSAASRRNMLSSWQPVSAANEGFPNRERYPAPLDQPSKAIVPSRATTIDFKADWMGALRDGWGTLPSVAAPIEVKLVPDASTMTIGLAGKITHNLPGTLRDVQVLHIWPRQNPLPTLTQLEGAAAETAKVSVRRFPGQLPNRGAMVTVPDWPRGESRELASIFAEPRPLSDRLGLERTLDSAYYSAIEQQLRNSFGMLGDSISLRDSMSMLSLYSMLQPPKYLRDQQTGGGALKITRLSGRELDLSDWMTQPCLIVMGWLEQVSLPFELTVDGEQPESNGLVFVRWIVPLPADWQWTVPEKVARGQQPKS